MMGLKIKFKFQTTLSYISICKQTSAINNTMTRKAQHDWSAKELATLPFLVRTEVRAGLAKREYYRNKLHNLGLPQEEQIIALPPTPEPEKPEPEPKPVHLAGYEERRHQLRLKRNAARRRRKKEQAKQDRHAWLQKYWGFDA